MFFPYRIFYDKAFNWLVLAVDQCVYVLPHDFLGMALVLFFWSLYDIVRDLPWAHENYWVGQ